MPADVVVLDLEDSVAPEDKERPPAPVPCEAVAGFAPRETVIRINALSSPWHVADLAAAAQLRRRRHPAAQSQGCR